MKRRGLPTEGQVAAAVRPGLVGNATPFFRRGRHGLVAAPRRIRGIRLTWRNFADLNLPRLVLAYSQILPIFSIPSFGIESIALLDEQFAHGTLTGSWC